MKNLGLFVLCLLSLPAFAAEDEDIFAVKDYRLRILGCEYEELSAADTKNSSHPEGQTLLSFRVKVKNEGDQTVIAPGMNLQAGYFVERGCELLAANSVWLQLSAPLKPGAKGEAGKSGIYWDPKKSVEGQRRGVFATANGNYTDLIQRFKDDCAAGKAKHFSSPDLVVCKKKRKTGGKKSEKKKKKSGKKKSVKK